MKYPAAISARHDEAAGKIVVELEHDIDLSFAPGAAQGLQGASASDLKALKSRAAAPAFGSANSMSTLAFLASFMAG